MRWEEGDIQAIERRWSSLGRVLNEERTRERSGKLDSRDGRLIPARLDTLRVSSKTRPDIERSTFESSCSSSTELSRTLRTRRGLKRETRQFYVSFNDDLCDLYSP